MSAAIRARDAKERANIAARFIRRGNTDSRAFGDCFEMGDGTQVVAYLLAKAVTDARIADYARRAQWSILSAGRSYDPHPVPTAPCTTCHGRGTFYESHGPGLTETLACDDCGGTGEVPTPKEN